MFEDKPTNPNQGASPLPRPASPAGGVPVDLPTGDQGEPPKPEEAKEPADILAEIDQVDPAVRGPDQAEPVLKSPVAPTPPAIPKPEKPVTKEPFFKAHKKAFLLIVFILFGGTALAVGGWYGYQTFVVPATSPTQPLGNQPQVNTNQPANVNTQVNTNQPPPRPVDTDHDGLSDEEEGMYGTDPTEIDTDKDGLTDKDEVKVFKTDPNNPDTDGDGFLDGEEIRGGYNPKGEGKLLEIE